MGGVDSNPDQPRIPWIGLALVSGAALGYEILLTRLLAIVHWHHFASMVISLALLGYGASGTFLFLWREWALRHAPGLFLGNVLLFALAAPACFLMAQAVPLNPSEIAWDWRLSGRLGLIYLLLSIPFFAAANCVGIALVRFSALAHRIYAFDLGGAGLGAVASVVLLLLLPVEQALLAVTLLGLVAGAMAAEELKIPGRHRMVAVALAAAGLLSAIPAHWLRVEPAAYKPLSQALSVVGARVEARVSSPLGRLTLLDNEQVPFRSAPGLSLLAAERPPKQLALFQDGNAAGAVPRVRDPGFSTAYLDALSSALPYHLVQKPNVLLIGLGGGSGLLQALSLGARQVTVVELDPRRLELLANYLVEPLQGPDVRVQVAEARSFLARSREHFDLIQLNLLGGGGIPGLHDEGADYLMTREALSAYIDHLSLGGILAITRWLRQPPRDSLKLTSSLVGLLQERDVADPDARIALIRSWKTVTLVLKNGVLNASDVAAVREFSQNRAFDSIYFPGIEGSEINRFNRLEQPVFHQGVQTLLGPDADALVAAYHFDLEPATDDRPFFNAFYRWDALPDLMRLPARAGLAHLDWGYLIQVATLAQAGVLGLLLILAPLLVRRRLRIPVGFAGRMLVYFALIGLSFMCVEIAFVQKLQLLLGHPLYAVALVLAGFLLFAGLGSAVSRQLEDRLRVPRFGCTGYCWGFVCLGGFSVLNLLLLSQGGDWLMAQPFALKVVGALLLIAPLAFCMGMPFPWGLRRLECDGQALIPWAWGVNGFASVVSAIGAGLLAMEIGFSGLVGVGLVGYLGAALLLGRHG